MARNITDHCALGVWVHDTATAQNNLHRMADLGFDYVSLKISDGTTAYDPAALRQVACDIAAARLDLPLVAWSYCYPDNIQSQIDVIVKHLAVIGASDLILDAEAEWEGADPSLATLLAHGIAVATGHKVTLHLSSFYWPSAHPSFPYDAFIEHCATWMPQSYKESADADLATILARTTEGALSVGGASLDRATVPTVNRPEVLTAIGADYDAMSVWLWRADAGDTTDLDEGVWGHGAEWETAIAAWRSCAHAAGN